VLYPIEKAELVDERRRSVGLPPMADYEETSRDLQMMRYPHLWRWPGAPASPIREMPSCHPERIVYDWIGRI
jgi:hypothetical protein